MERFVAAGASPESFPLACLLFDKYVIATLPVQNMLAVACACLLIASKYIGQAPLDISSLARAMGVVTPHVESIKSAEREVCTILRWDFHATSTYSFIGAYIDAFQINLIGVPMHISDDVLPCSMEICDFCFRGGNVSYLPDSYILRC